jgi:hypothetical protein
MGGAREHHRRSAVLRRLLGHLRGNRAARRDQDVHALLDQMLGVAAQFRRVIVGPMRPIDAEPVLAMDIPLALKVKDQRRDLLFLVLIVFRAAVYDSHCWHGDRPSAVSIK